MRGPPHRVPSGNSIQSSSHRIRRQMETRQWMEELQAYSSSSQKRKKEERKRGSVLREKGWEETGALWITRPKVWREEEIIKREGGEHIYIPLPPAGIQVGRGGGRWSTGRRSYTHSPGGHSSSSSSSVDHAVFFFFYFFFHKHFQKVYSLGSTVAIFGSFTLVLAGSLSSFSQSLRTNNVPAWLRVRVTDVGTIGDKRRKEKCAEWFRKRKEEFPPCREIYKTQRGWKWSFFHQSAALTEFQFGCKKT